MIKRLVRSRGMKKFMRNRLALFSTGIIGVYFAVFVSIWLFGTLTRADTSMRVLPKNMPGFLQTPTVDKDFYTVGWYTARFRSVFGRDLESMDNPRIAFNEISLAERQIADLPPTVLRVLYDTLIEVYEKADDAYLQREDLLDETGAIRDDINDLLAESPVDQELIDALEAEYTEYAAELEEVEAVFFGLLSQCHGLIDELMPMPTGWSGFVYKFRTFLGSDVVGRSISSRGVYSIKIAFQIGIVVATMSVVIGTLLGAAAGFFGGWVDVAVMWVVSTLSSIPYLVLLLVISFMFVGHPLFDNPTEHPEYQLVKLYVAMGLVFWISTARVIRGEVMKIKELEYVQAATALGFGRIYIMVRHVIPNTTHIMFINFSLLVIGAIKGEVILSFLGLGISGQPSWGTMISNSKDDVQNYFFWEIGTASVLMFGLVLAFNIVSDALQDAFDPKHVS